MGKVTEKEARHGTFELFRVAGKSVKAKIRTMNDNEDWLDEAEKVIALGDACNGRASQRKYNEALVDCVFSYDESIDRDEYEAQITAVEVYDAFETIRVSTDLFLSMKLKKDAENLKQLEQTRDVLSVMPQAMQENVMKLMESGEVTI